MRISVIYGTLSVSCKRVVSVLSPLASNSCGGSHIVRSLKRNLDDFQVHLLDELRILAYLRKTLLESSEIFVEHTRQVARTWFRTQSCACDSGLGYVHRIINKWMLALEKNSLTRENKID